MAACPPIPPEYLGEMKRIFNESKLGFMILKGLV